MIKATKSTSRTTKARQYFSRSLLESMFNSRTKPSMSAWSSTLEIPNLKRRDDAPYFRLVQPDRRTGGASQVRKRGSRRYPARKQSWAIEGGRLAPAIGRRYRPLPQPCTGGLLHGSFCLAQLWSPSAFLDDNFDRSRRAGAPPPMRQSGEPRPRRQRQFSSKDGRTSCCESTTVFQKTGSCWSPPESPFTQFLLCFRASGP